MKEARRRPGSEWIKNHPAALERVYAWTARLFRRLWPFMKRVSPVVSTRALIWGEEVVKGYVWNCQMCGQCILHSTGMTCPMTCPKNLRNGPCGGVRANGNCEVIPEMPCVWVQAWERSKEMPVYGHEILWLQPPVNRLLQDTSAWANMATGRDAETPAGWKSVELYAETTKKTDMNQNSERVG